MDMEKWNIGCSGFYYREWKNLFYPPDLPQREWFDFYCNHFNTLEINATFYHFPLVKTLNNWYDKSPDGFVFSVKAPRMITHYQQFVDCEALIRDFYARIAEGLKEKSGCILFQLPPKVSFSEEVLTRICTSLDPSFHNVVEFRHMSWWQQNVYDRLAEHNITFCSVGYPKLPQTLIVNTDTPYVRLHGTPRLYYSEYPKETLSTLAGHLKTHKSIGQAYIYFDNTAEGHAITNARELKEMLSVNGPESNAPA